MTPHKVKILFSKLQEAMANKALFATALCDDIDKDAIIRMCAPFGDLTGGEAWFDQCYAPLFTAFPDLSRHDMILLTGQSQTGDVWLASMGNYMGSFFAPFLAIPPTGQLCHMRYHEFYRFENDKIVEIQAIWDIPEVMMQAKAWPLAPQLGAFLCTPAPMTQDGLWIEGKGDKAYHHVINMLQDLCRHPQEGGPQVMKLEQYWHPDFNWYGPAGIGTARGVAGFRHWHQIPFLHAMPDRKLDEKAALHSHWLAAHDYVAETGWPNMRLTLSGDGWLGIPPVDKEICLRSLDFWRLDKGKIRENWVLVDLLDMYGQIGVDVFARLREFNKARVQGVIGEPLFTG